MNEAPASAAFRIRLLRPDGASFLCAANQTLLDAALQSRVAVPYGCGVGRCTACRARAVEGSFKRLDTLVNKRAPAPDVVYPCCTKPLSDMALSYAEV
ncbi:2Fe-2S iron-sulfur cluster binding domain-containing protein [Ramlibacter sp.]|uniref:2Fe-2S iron-sulfur cluster-binding protein n=1 Tax=Ramlibacter sp. TaxID=1917967 RepID=UPI0017902D9D|nr:2Fe-2S iron-sulfur cluster binding domain-containing protein [Ramlibacter sp.]MBA2672402.1 2Fe-2S iron-sulfur cluster binding domain-containing protein [Ramlibacter sp.]